MSDSLLRDRFEILPSSLAAACLEFYGDIDYIPTEEYSRQDALRAIEDARLVVSVASSAIPLP